MPKWRMLTSHNSSPNLSRRSTFFAALLCLIAIFGTSIALAAESGASAPTPLQAFNQWAPIVWLKTNPFAYPVLEVVHIMGFALVFGSIVIVDLRILGRLATIDAIELTKRVLPWTLSGFAVALLTGFIMFASRVSDFIANPAFIVKMCLLFAAGTNAAILHARGTLDVASRLSKLQAALSIAIWLAVISAGRWIAYV
jgi:hypothetical protein